MTASNGSTHPSSGEGIGETDLARLDAHEIQPEEYDDLPEITDAMVARGAPGDGAEIAKRGRGRPRVEHPKQQVTMRLDAGVIAAMRESGPGWQSRANDALRAWFGLGAEAPADEADKPDREARRVAKGGKARRYVRPAKARAPRRAKASA